MSHQRYTSHDAVKEPHSVSVKVLRLSQPSLERQYAIEPPLSLGSSSGGSSPSTKGSQVPSAPASLAYSSNAGTNSDPFLLSPIVNLPGSFGSAYVGETFSCTLCANNDLAGESRKRVRDVRIEAEMKTAGGAAVKLGEGAARDLGAGETLQKVVGFELKEEGNHVLAVTVSYYEATETSGRTRTFRKLYQFVCKASLIVRTKVSGLEREQIGNERSKREGGSERKSKDENEGESEGEGESEYEKKGENWRRRWVLEAQLENCSEEVMMLEKVVLDVDEGMGCEDCNWEADGEKPVLHPGEVEQVCFVVRQMDGGGNGGRGVTSDGRLMFGVLGIGWRGGMGNRGFLSTGKLGVRVSM